MAAPPLYPTFFAVLTGWLVLFPAGSIHAHGGFHERATALTAALKERPDDPDLLFQFALANLDHGDWEVTLLQLNRVEQLAPGKYPTDLVRGRALAGGGKFEAARKALDAFLATHPRHGLALAARARVASELGDPQQAVADATAAIDTTTRPEPDAYFELANFLVAAGRSAEAIQALDQGMTKLGPLPALFNRALELEISLDRKAAVVARLDTQLVVTPPELQPARMAQRAAILARIGRLEDAHKAWLALRDRLTALPPLERNSHAMLRFAEQANEALAALENSSP
jgi:tetratricopeptide (TPR) repeat protein